MDRHAEYVEAISKIADFIDALAELSREHGVHVESSSFVQGALMVVPNGRIAPIVPVQFAWAGDDYKPATGLR